MRYFEPHPLVHGSNPWAPYRLHLNDTGLIGVITGSGSGSLLQQRGIPHDVRAEVGDLVYSFKLAVFVK